jgi:preprotein translocase subunit SecY
MIRIRATTAADAPRRIPEFWRKTGLALATLAVCEIGARIVAPGLNARVLRDFLRGGSGNWLVRVYDWFVGGAISHGAVLALGVMPYLSARIMMRLVHAITPKETPSEETERRRKRMTRWLTGGLALVQSYGYAAFVQSIPGAVANPGFGFLAKTMAVLTTGALGVMFLSERLTERRDYDEPVTEPRVGDSPIADDEHRPDVETTGERLLPAGQPPETELYRPRDRAEARREPRSTERTD